MKTTKEIKVYKPLVWVRVAFGPQIEVLYWEWTEDNFKQKRASLSYIYFTLYDRHVPESEIKDFWQVKDVKNLAREWKISSLTEEQKSEVKELASRMLKNIWREPTDSEFEKMISYVLEKNERIQIKKYSYLCDYWHTHPSWEQCNCFSIYKTFWILFQDELRKIGYEIRDKSDITKEMQEKFLSTNNKR